MYVCVYSGRNRATTIKAFTQKQVCEIIIIFFCFNDTLIEFVYVLLGIRTDASQDTCAGRRETAGLVRACM